jgi:transcriptional regulator with PAS, ATPase and Fis domain
MQTREDNEPNLRDTALRVPTLVSLNRPEVEAPSIKAKALIFADPVSRQLLAYIEKLAPSEAPVLIIGETGTGKELVAQHMHQLSGRRGPFLAVNCGAISEQLSESELFGHEAGAFTGAVGRREGWFEAAHGGTLFLDEIGDLPAPMQVKLLRVLQEREIVRIGSRKSIPVNVRVVAATNLDLQHAVAAGHFRRDLYYRLNVAQAYLPPLRERPGDVLPLVHYFIGLYSERARKPVPTLSPDAAAALLAQEWPGNTRELENAVQFALLMSGGDSIRLEHLRLNDARLVPRDANPWSPARADVPICVGDEAQPLERMAIELRRSFANPGEALYDRLERLIVTEAFEHCAGNQSQSAALLGITRNMVRTLLKRHALLNDVALTGSALASRRTEIRAWTTDVGRS